jgi:hypothetical protein
MSKLGPRKLVKVKQSGVKQLNWRMQHFSGVVRTFEGLMRVEQKHLDLTFESSCGPSPSANSGWRERRQKGTVWCQEATSRPFVGSTASDFLLLLVRRISCCLAFD